MQDIRVYDFNFNLLHIENMISSVDWVIKFNDIGTFEAHFPINAKIVSVAMKNDYLIVVQGENQAIITGKSAFADFTLFGRTPNFILSKRVTPNFTKKEGTIEEICADIVSDAFFDVENFVVKRTSGFTNSINFWRNVYNPTFKVISECLDREKAGHKVYFDFENKQWVYTALKGKNTDIVFSRGKFNASNISYVEDFKEHVNGGFYEVINGDTNESTWEEIASDKQGIYKWMGVLGGNSLSDAKDSLLSRKWKKDVKFDIKDFKFNKDYHLGDKVKVKTEIGDFKRYDEKYISAVNIWYENANSGEKPVFKDV